MAYGFDAEKGGSSEWIAHGRTSPCTAEERPSVMIDATTHFHEFEQSGWQRAAAHYDVVFQALTTQSIVPLLDAVGSGAGTRFVDLASGPGYVATAASARGAQALAIDFSETMIALGRKRHPGITLELGDVEALTLADLSVDAAVMAYGLLHLPSPDQALAEAYRILRPGGRFAATVWAPPERSVGFALILDAIRAHGRLDVPLPAGPPFFRFSDHAEFRRSMHAAGFRDIEVREVDQVWHLRDADQFLTAMRYGTVRTGALLAVQTASQLAGITSAIAEACADYRLGHELLLPMPAVLAVGTRPVRDDVPG
jgi:SAM-dependent methyltransferase